MILDIYTIARDRTLYNAEAKYEDGKVVVKKGSKINLNSTELFNPPIGVKETRGDREKVDANGILLQNIEFSSLSTAATFVTGRVSNGMICWKTKDGEYVRKTLKPEN